MGLYNSDPNLTTLAEYITATGGASSEVKGKIWARMLEVGAQTEDDFAKLQGGPDSKMPFWKKTDLKADGGDKVVFSVLGGAAGPGARGEEELTGRTSEARLGTYSCQVDFWRDAVELTKKEVKFLAGGKALEPTLLKMLSEKLGRKRMYDMMHTLIRTTSALFMRPNNKQSRDTIRHTDTLTPNFLVEAKARAQGRGARPISKAKMKSGAPINHFMAFIAQDAMTDIRNSTSFQNACLQASPRSNDENPLFSGALPDWQGMLFWEHIVVDPDTNDKIGSPMAPKAVLGAAVVDADLSFVVKGGDGTSTLCRYFEDFPGYDYLFTEDQTAAPDSTSYYFWVINTSGEDVGKACFYKYTGSTNSGNQITAITERLHATTTGTFYKATVGNVTYASVNDQGLFSAAHPAGSWIIPANAYGVPIGRNFLFGAGCAMRAFGSIEADVITQDRDYKFIKGMGYEGIWGQRACLDTLGIPRGYIVLESAIEHPGITVPYLTT